MGFNKKIVPNQKVLELYLQQNGSESFYKKYIKGIDAFIGSSKGINFLKKFKNKYYDEKCTSVFYGLD
jgi:hypothetical protein